MLMNRKWTEEEKVSHSKKCKEAWTKRESKIDDDTIEKIRFLYSEGISHNNIAKKFGISLNSVVRYSDECYKDKHDFVNKNPCWKLLRESILRERKVCETCGCDTNLIVHHKDTDLSPEDYMKVNENDLSLLCNKCHIKVHNTFVKEKRKLLSKLKYRETTLIDKRIEALQKYFRGEKVRADFKRLLETGSYPFTLDDLLKQKEEALAYNTKVDERREYIRYLLEEY